MNDYWLAALLGVLEGVTEFLPISSTGHLLLAERMLGLDLEGEFWKLFTVVIQLGAILAVVVLFRGRLAQLIRDFLRPGPGSPPRWRHPLVLVLAAVVPAGLAGLLLKSHIDRLMERALPIGIALVAGAVAIEVIERACRGRARTDDVAGVRPGQALGIGLAQAVALVPGVSRSASTILGGRLAGLSLPAAADFSFLLSIPTMTAAAGYSLVKARTPLDQHQVLVLAVGFVTSFAVAMLVVAWFLRYLKKHGFRIFVVYRILLGAVVLGLWAAGRLP